MSVNMRVRSAVLAAAAAASFLGGIGVADAATSAPASGPGTTASVDVNAHGAVAHATIRSGPHRMGTSLGRPVARALSSDFSAIATADNARIRASAPRGRILGVTHHDVGGNVDCKVSGGDGHLWGRVGFRSDWGYRPFVTGFMRDDLFQVWVVSGQFTSDARVLPWC
uniref:hypothetical protein n=1 Tax=Amycolatopsis sp. CA-096443 TaxID=3239919 RepID=UPI003F495BF8